MSDSFDMMDETKDELKNNICLGHFFYFVLQFQHTQMSNELQYSTVESLKPNRKKTHENIFLLQIVWLLIRKVVIFEYFAPENWENVIIGHDDSTKIIMLIFTPQSSLIRSFALLQRKECLCIQVDFLWRSNFSTDYISIHRLSHILWVNIFYIVFVHR